MKNPRITIITFAWPPRNSIGAHRPYSWAKSWSSAGATVRVITAKKFSYDAPLDLNLPQLPGVELVETDYSSSKTSLFRIASSGLLKKPARWAYQKLVGKTRIVSNPRDSWFLAATPMISEWARSCDYVVSTYDPMSVHQIAAAMKASNPRLKWIADYRDLWSLNHTAKWTDSQRMVEREREIATVGRYADLITSVSADLTHQQSRFLNKPGMTVTNGFDIDPRAVSASITSGLRPTSEPMSIVYTGKVYPEHQDPSPLLRAIVAMEERGEISKGSVQLHIYGGQVDGLDDVIRLGQYNHILHMHGHVTRDAALAAQSQADLLLLLESSSIAAKGVLTGKIFEYMATGVPILSLGSRRDSSIGEMLEKTGVGICTEDNPRMIEQAILDRRDGNSLKWFRPNEDEILSFSREKIATRFLQEVLSEA
jgi:glycosyltransferase involved in cell wall biosynthesis